MISIAKDLGMTREAIYQRKWAAAKLPTGTVPQRKSGSGAPKKTTSRTGKLLRREVMSNHAIIAVELKN